MNYNNNVLRKPGKVDWLLYGFIFLNIITIRLFYFRFPGTNLLYIEPLFFVLLFHVLLKSFLINKNFFKTSLTGYFFYFVLYSAFSVLMGLTFHDNELANAMGKFRKICVYPIIFFVTYNYIDFGKIFSLARIHKLLFLSFMSIIAISLGWGLLGLRMDYAGYIQVFYNLEGWVISYFLFFLFASLSQKKKSIPLSTIVLALSSIIVVTLTSRRGVWIVTALGAVAAYFLYLERIRLRNFLKLIPVILISFALLFFLTTSLIKNPESGIIDTLAHRFNRLIDLFNQNENEYYSTGIMDARLTRYRDGLNYFLENPIFGKGMGFQSDFLFAGSDGNFFYRQSTFHCAYLEILVTGGFVGLVLFLLIHLKFVSRILKIKNKINPVEKKYFIALFVVYLNGMIWSIVDNNFVSNSNFIFHIYFIMGVLAKYSDTLLEKYKRQKYDQLLVRQ